MRSRSLKTRTAHSLKWNMVDRVSTQILYAVTGIVLARELSPADFGLVGAVLVFQAFANLLVDGGFSYALLQHKRPTRLDYSTVLWFNVIMATSLYIVLYFAAPLIAWWFEGDGRIIPLARVMFITLVINAFSSAPTFRLTKAMEARGVAVANASGLVAGGIVGIAMALTNFGAWAIVGQTLTSAAVRCLTLWTSSPWRPLRRFSRPVLRSFFGLGWRMMLTSFLNTVFLNVYAFFIGNRVGLAPLGYYTQADKWSKMGTASLSQVLTSSFVPALSTAQDDPDRFRALCSKMTRFTAYILFPAMIWLAVAASPVFHALFGSKWDPAVLLFQILLIRGIFVVLTSLSVNFLLALGHGSDIVRLEIVRDAMALIALAITFPYMDATTAAQPAWGLAILLWGQFAASAVAWLLTAGRALWRCKAKGGAYLMDLAPYLVLAVLPVPLMAWAAALLTNPWAQLAAEGAVALGIYLGVNALLGSKIQKDVLAYLANSLKKP